MTKQGAQILERKRIAGALSGLQKRINRLDTTYVLIEKLVEEHVSSIHLDRTTQRLLCAFLYWGEGVKTHKELRFINSDPEMIKVFLYLLRKSFKIDENKLRATLHVHEYHDVQRQLQYWSQTTKIPISRIRIYRKPNSGKIVRQGYPGCISINYGDSKLFTALTGYYKLFGKSRGLSVPSAQTSPKRLEKV